MRRRVMAGGCGGGCGAARLTSAAVLLAVRIQRWRSSSLAEGRCLASPARGEARTREWQAEACWSRALGVC